MRGDVVLMSTREKAGRNFVVDQCGRRAIHIAADTVLSNSVVRVERPRVT
jgi:hypothetical protein